MLSTILLMAVVLAVGTRATDSLRVKQEEVILHKLSVADAHDYYELLKKRARRVRLFRAITLAAALLALLAARRRLLMGRKPASADQIASSTGGRGMPTNTDAAKAIAGEELARQAARGVVDPTKLELSGVSGDDTHPWIFEYRPTARASGDRVRIYVDRAGAAELHRIP